MRVLMVHNKYARPSGEEYAVGSIAGLLQARGHEVALFTRSSADIGDSIWRKARAFFSGIYSFRARRDLSAVLQEVQPDVAQVQNLYPWLSPSVLLACRDEGIPVVMRCPNYRLLCPNGLHLSRGQVCERCLGVGKELWCVVRNCEQSIPKSVGYALRTAFARVSGLIKNNVDVFMVLSEFQKQRFVSAGIEADKIEVIPSYVKAPDSATVEPSHEGGTVSFAGRLSPEKGIDLLLEAAWALPQLSFEIAADTSQAESLVRAAPENVTFCGYLGGSDWSGFFRRCRVFVLPSRCFEGFPNVVATAMAFGKPVVSSRLGVLPEIVDDGTTGLLFEPGNQDDLIKTLEHLWHRPDLCRRMGEAGRAKALREYCPDKYYARLMTAYSKAGAAVPAETTVSDAPQLQRTVRGLAATGRRGTSS